jgi:hypothetical protein
MIRCLSRSGRPIVFHNRAPRGRCSPLSSFPVHSLHVGTTKTATPATLSMHCQNHTSNRPQLEEVNIPRSDEALLNIEIFSTLFRTPIYICHILLHCFYVSNGRDRLLSNNECRHLAGAPVAVLLRPLEHAMLPLFPFLPWLVPRTAREAGRGPERRTLWTGLL